MDQADQTTVGNLPNLKLCSSQLEQALKVKALGETFTYPELSELAGCDVLECRTVLETTKRNLLRHHNILLSNIRGTGYRICEPGQFHVEAQGYMKKSTKALKKSSQILNVADLSQMSEEDKLETIKQAGKCQMLLIVSKIASKDKLANVIDYSRPPSEESVLKFLIDKSVKPSTKATK